MRDRSVQTNEKSTREHMIYVEYPVSRSVATMVIPTIISQIINVIYNMADTWFIGFRGNAAAVAAIALCLPLYNIMTAFGNLFGIGGASVISRALGSKDTKRAQTAFSQAFKTGLITAAVYSLILLVISRNFLLLIGADGENIGFAVRYTMITMVIGGIPTILTGVCAHLIRSTSRSNIASIGMMTGAFLNMGLDPLFIFVILPPGNEVLGAAIATVIAQSVSFIFFLSYIIRHRENPVFRFRPERLPNTGEIRKDVVKSGIPSFFLLASGQISNFVLNGMLASLGASAAVAAMGVVRRIDSLAFSVNQGITQGIIPIIGYCYSQRLPERIKKVVSFSSLVTMCFSGICSALSFIFAPQLIRFFIDDANTIMYGTIFQRIMCIAVVLYPVVFIIMAVFQAAGQSLKPFMLSIIHKGSIDIVLFFVIRALFGTEYILWASPIMAGAALMTALILYSRLKKEMVRNMTAPPKAGVKNGV